MNFIDNFSTCDSDSPIIFKQNNIPIFQNKVYETETKALKAVMGDVELVQSMWSGFIFNKAFDLGLMQYDENYQNEQSKSLVFQKHLDSVLRLLLAFGMRERRVVEIGTGKGVFFELLLKEGIDCWGFDPTYEGSNERIIKEYFSDKYNNINADIIIMRHTLEHIPMPFSFIHTIAKANQYKGYLFIEVPTFDWIVKKNAFWDIFYEHCNYFTQHSLCSMFDQAISGDLFGGQYIYLWADLSTLRSSIPKGQNFDTRTDLELQDTLDYYFHFLKSSGSMAVWGAGAKGSTFLNLLDPKREYVSYVIDINPAKQNRYIAGTGHVIFPPEALQSKPVENILIMNENYFDEIESSQRNVNIKLLKL
jgi:Methyltransferase domain/C-methyltransferase C-terminal domain